MTETFYLRQGECNWCGQCCGSGYSFGGTPPVQESPWPVSWPGGLLAWSQEAFDTHFALRSIISKASLTTLSGEINWRGFKRKFIFVPGESLCLDLPPLGNPTTHEKRCPMLVLNGEGSTPPTQCGVAPDCPVWTDHCSELPPTRITERAKQEWEEAFPACSYTWVVE